MDWQMDWQNTLQTVSSPARINMFVLFWIQISLVKKHVFLSSYNGPLGPWLVTLSGERLGWGWLVGLTGLVDLGLDWWIGSGVGWIGGLGAG